MSDVMTYKNYQGTVEYSEKDNCLFGKVIGIRSTLSYEGNSIEELRNDFEEIIDDYLEDCKKEGVEPEKPFKGTFNVRIKPELHRSLMLYAQKQKKTLNAAVEEAIEKMVSHN